MKRTFQILVVVLWSLSMAKCSNSNPGPQEDLTILEETPHDTILPKKDTMNRNSFIGYNITSDTLIGDLLIRVTKQNIDGEYIHQDFYLKDSLLIRNFYPEIKTHVWIQKGPKTIFDRTFLKNDLPPGNFHRYIDESTIQDFRFETIYAESEEMIFKVSLYIPNSDFENDFDLRVSMDGQYKLEWIDYEGE